MNKKESLLKLFFSFSKIGIMTFGGGYSMLPMLQEECIKKNKWATEDEMLDYFAIAQCTPGIIAVNTATFIGYKLRRGLGAIVATLGVVFPSFVIITLLASAIRMFQDNPYLIKAFAGIRISVSALIANSVLKFAKKGLKNILLVIFALSTLAIELILKVSPVYPVVFTVMIALLFYRFGYFERKEL